MNQGIFNQYDPDMINEHDSNEGIQEKYVQRYYTDINLTRFNNDVTETFPDAKSVNEGLRTIEKSLHIRKKSHKLEPFRFQLKVYSPKIDAVF